MNVNFTKPPSVLEKDPHFNNVSLLMHMDGSSGSKNFVDSSTNNIQSTAIGNIEVSSAITRFGNGAAFLYGNNTGNYIRISGNSNLAVGTGDYTLEMWAYVNSNNPFVIFDAAPINSPSSRLNAFLFYLENTREPRFFGGGFSILSPVASFPINQWAHLALVRNTGTTTIYINGTGVSNSTGFYNATLATGGCLIGGFADSLNFNSNGYIDELRLTKGVARYTGNFTPPTTEFPDASYRKSLFFTKSNDGKKTLLRQVNLPIEPAIPIPSNYLAFWKLNDLADSSPNGNTLINTNNVQFVPGKIGNCAEFDGTTIRYLGIDSFSSPFNTASPYTISLWYNLTTLRSLFTLIGCGNNNTFNMHGDSTGGLSINNSANSDVSISNFFTTNSWNHIVVTRDSSNQMRVWKNGIKVYDSPATVSYGNVPFIDIGFLRGYGASFLVDGKIDAIGVWQRDLIQSEIDILYNNGIGREP